MTKDEILGKIKGDKTKVYGQSMLDMFLRTAESIERRHIDELPGDKRSLVSPQCLLNSSTTPEEAEEAIAKGGNDFDKALGNAAKRENTVMIDFFIDKLPANFRVASLRATVSSAARAGSLKGVRHLVEKGAEPSTVAMDGAAQMGHLEIVKYLLSSKYKFDLSSSLWWAASAGKADVVEYLIYNKADEIHNIDKAFEVAAEMGHTQVVDFLMDEGPKNTGEALQAAMQAGRQEIVDILVDKGANPEPAILWAFFSTADGYASNSRQSIIKHSPIIKKALARMLDRSERVEKIARELARYYPDVAEYMSERDKSNR